MSNEEMALAIQAGDNSLILPLWEQCKGLICKEAYRWARAFDSRPEIDVDDLIQSGYFALVNITLVTSALPLVTSVTAAP